MKKKILCLCGAFTFFVASGAIALSSETAQADSTVSFSMENGAAVHKDGGGLRFSAKLDLATYATICKDENATFGMIIVPADSVYVDTAALEYADSSVYSKTVGYELTEDNVWSENAKFSTNPTDGQKLVIDEQATTGNGNLVVGKDSVTIYGSIENFLAQNYVRSFVGRAYYYTQASGYVFADYFDDLTNDNETPIENNTRCMYYVAQQAIENGDELATAVEEQYIDGFEGYLTANNKSSNYRYFIDTYIDGKYDSTKVAYGKINTTVSVTPESKDGYGVKESESKLSGTIYAAGKQRLTISYVSAPKADITTWAEDQLPEVTVSETTAKLETAYTFSTTDTKEQAMNSVYANWKADYVVSFDKAIAEGTICLAGSYESYNNGEWVAFTLGAMSQGETLQLLEQVNRDVRYYELCDWVQSFDCGAFNFSKANVGTTMTVELRLINPDDATDYKTINSTSYTFKKFVSVPEAEITTWTEDKLPEVTINGTTATLETAYTFSTTDTKEQAMNSVYANWKADYVVSFDKAIAEGTICLAGSYASYNNGEWVAFTLEAMSQGETLQLLNWAGRDVRYYELCDWVQSFDCGAFNFSKANVGTTMTVELRLINPEDATDYKTINSTSYTFKKFVSVPEAEITTWTEDKLPEVTINGTTATLETAYTFSTTDTKEQAMNSVYADWKADYVVSFDKAIAEGTICLAGSYESYNNGEWVAFTLGAMSQGETLLLLDWAGREVRYYELCDWIQSFDCGAFNFSEANVSTTMTVELRLINPEDATDYKTINSTSYTFTESVNK